MSKGDTHRVDDIWLRVIFFLLLERVVESADDALQFGHEYL
jgi:hypothetical protein